MQNNTQSSSHIHWFRNSAPYINTHRGKTFVIMFGGEAVAHPNFSSLIHDFALLHSLGIKLVLVYGARVQINEALANANIAAPVANDIRITTKDSLPYVLQAVGAIRLQIEARLSMGLANSPMYGARIDAVSGNFVVARPYGVRDGIDYELTGEVRSVDVEAIKNNLNNHHIVLLGPTGFSATGEIFNVLAEEVALQTAISLNADKLIFLGDDVGVKDGDRLLRELIPNEVDRFLQDKDKSIDIYGFLNHASTACRQGVHRTHILSYAKDGALIEELFTRDGSGTLISHDAYEEIRKATFDDIVGLTELLAPLEAQGILIKRGKERIEQDLEYYTVIERDGMVLGCGALYPLDDGKSAEIASIAIHPEYRQGSRGSDLLLFLEHQARSQGLYTVFALTTRTAHWFMEHGFHEVDFTALPPIRQEKYHNGRNSKVLKKDL